MVVRKRKKMNKQLGKRTHGHGDKKNWKGKGVRGGLGKAGSHKHKYATYYMAFGNKIKLKPKKKAPAMNILQINQMIPEWLEAKKIEQKGDTVTLDGKKIGISKILGRGNVSQKWVLKNITVAKNALDKIQAAGGAVQSSKNSQGVDA